MMMHALLFFAWLLVAPVWAGTLCSTTTAAEDARLADAATREGTTVQATIDATIHDMIASKYNASVMSSVGLALSNAWPTLTNAKKTNVCTQLDVSPCPP